MEDLIITLLIIATGYYLLTKPANNCPLTHSQSTQTETLPNPDEKLLESTLDELINQIKKFNQSLK